MRASSSTRLIKTLRKKNIKIDKAEIVYVSDERVSNISGTQFYPAIFKANNIAFGEPIAHPVQELRRVAAGRPGARAQSRRGGARRTPDSAGKVIKELRRQGFQGRVIGSQIFADPNSLELFGRDADGMIIVAGYWWDRNDATRAFTKKFAEENAKRGLADKKNSAPHRRAGLRHRLPAEAGDGEGQRHRRSGEAGRRSARPSATR